MSDKIVHDFDPRNLPPDLLTAVGLAVVSFAQTEGIIEMAIAGCLGVDAEYGAAVTTHMSAPLRFSVLKSVAEIHIDDLDTLDQLDTHLEELEIAFKKRNDLMHNQWARHGKTGELFTVKETARTRYEAELIPMSIDDVKSDALFIYKAGINFMSFLMAKNLLPPIPPLRPRYHKSKTARKKRRNTKRK